MTQVETTLPKRCSCGLLWTHIPEIATYSDAIPFQGHYWECRCRSTLFVPDPRIELPTEREPGPWENGG